MVRRPVIEAREDRGGAVLSYSQSWGGATAADLGLDEVYADEGHAFLGDRRGSGAGDLDQFATRMGPAMCQLDARTDPVRCDQAVVSAVAVRRANSPPDCLLTLLTLQDAAKALLAAFGMLSAPTGGVGEDHAWWCRTTPGPVIADQGPEVSGPSPCCSNQWRSMARFFWPPDRGPGRAFRP